MFNHLHCCHKTIFGKPLLYGLILFNLAVCGTRADTDLSLEAFHPSNYDEAGCPVEDRSLLILDIYRLFTRPKGRFQPSVYPNVIGRDFQRGHDEFLSLKVLTLTDGSDRLLAGGFASNAAYPGAESHGDFLLVRYFPVGVIDREFATEGVYIRDFARGNDRIWDIQPLNDGTGRFLVAGSASNAARVSTGDKATSKDMVLMLFFENGEPDHSFGENGVVIKDISQGNDEILATVLLEVNGQRRIMAAGYTTEDKNRNRILLSYTLDGQPLAECGGQGYTLSNDSGDDEFRALQLLTLPDNAQRIIAAGYLTGPSNHGRDFLMASFRPDCEPDTGFGNNGKVTRNFLSNQRSSAYGYDEIIGALQVVHNSDQPQILTAGISKTYLKSDGSDFVDRLIVSRYRSDGTLDTTFGSGGDVRQDIFHPLEEPITLEVITHSNGQQHIVVGKYGEPFCSADNSVLVSMPFSGNRLNNTLLEGSLETGFFHFGEASAGVRGVVNITLSDGSRHLIAAGYGFGTTGTACACTTQNDLMLASFAVNGEQSRCFSADAHRLRQKESCADLLADIDTGTGQPVISVTSTISTPSAIITSAHSLIPPADHGLQGAPPGTGNR